MGKTKVICVMFRRDVARQKLLKSVNISRSYSQNNTGTVFLRHGVFARYAQRKRTYSSVVCGRIVFTDDLFMYDSSVSFDVLAKHVKQ